MATPRRLSPDHPEYVPGSRSSERYARTYQRWLYRLALPWIVLCGAVPFVAKLASGQFWPWAQYGTLAAVLISAVWIALLLIHRVRVQRALLRTYQPVCPACGYELGSTDACPECGLTLCMEDRKQAWRDAGYRLRGTEAFVSPSPDNPANPWVLWQRARSLPPYAGHHARRQAWLQAIGWALFGGGALVLIACRAAGGYVFGAHRALDLAYIGFIAAAVGLEIARRRLATSLWRTPEPPCPGCGYFLGTLPVCPECGLALDMEDRKQAWRNAGYYVQQP